MDPYAITDDQFEQTVLQEKNLPVLVYFWQRAASNSHTILYFINKCRNNYQSRMVIVTLNIEQNQRYAEQFRITALPTTIFFRDGKEIERLTASSTALIEDRIRARC